MSEENDRRGIFDPARSDEDAPPIDPSAQRPMEVNPSEYIETGHLPVVNAADGGVIPGGGPPREMDEPLTALNLVCTSDPQTGRKTCKHYTALLTDADGVTRGAKRRMMQIRRFCARLATATEMFELGSVPVHACTSREPQDARSIAMIEEFEVRQRAIAAEQNQKSADLDL